jgi:hypothetical protein
MSRLNEWYSEKTKCILNQCCPGIRINAMQANESTEKFRPCAFASSCSFCIFQWSNNKKIRSLGVMCLCYFKSHFKLKSSV